MSTISSPDPFQPNENLSLHTPDVMGLCCVAVGTDVVWVPRVESAWIKFGNRYAKKLFAADEVAYCTQQSGDNVRALAQRLAARLAVKEAVAKALGCGLNGLGYGHGVAWHCIETIARPNQPPLVRLHNSALDIQNAQGIDQWKLSWSHDGDYAVAVVVGLGQ